MDPVSLISGGVSLLGSLFGGEREGQTAEEQAYAEALRRINALPDIDWSKVIPQLSSYQGQQIEEAILEGDRAKLESAVASLPEADKGLVKAQMDALGQLERQGREGFTISDIADLKSIQAQQAAQARRAKQDVAANMEARGMASSGANIAAQMAASQAGANRAAQEQLAIAAQRQQAKRDALLGAGDLASKYRQQEFGEQSTKAQAKDLMSKFNEEMAANRAMRNIEAQRGIQDQRLAERRAAEASRVGASNQMATARAGIPLAQREAEMEKIGTIGGLGVSKAKAGQAADAAYSKGQASMWGGIGDAASSILGSEGLDVFGSKKKKKG